MADGIEFVVAAFAVTWLVFVGYALWLRRAVRRAREAYDRAGDPT